MPDSDKRLAADRLRESTDVGPPLTGNADWDRQWYESGLIGPHRVMDRSEASELATRFRCEYTSSGSEVTMNRHADLPVLAEICGDARIWAPAHRILGKRLLLWRTNVFDDAAALPWHEDPHAKLFGTSAFSVSSMLALEDNPPDNCVVFVPGSHTLSAAEKEHTYGLAASYPDSGNVRYVARSGEIASRLCYRATIEAGELIVFHPRLLHASSAYVDGRPESPTRRTNFTMRVVTPGHRVLDTAFRGKEQDKGRVLRVLTSAH